MNAVDTPRKKRVFIASSQADVAEVQKAMQQFDLDAVTIEQTATPGTTWVDSLHRCLNEADMVIGIMGDRRKDRNVFFELGVASALNKDTWPSPTTCARPGLPALAPWPVIQPWMLLYSELGGMPIKANVGSWHIASVIAARRHVRSWV